MVTSEITNTAVFLIIPLWSLSITTLHLGVPQTPSCAGSAEPGGGMLGAEGVMGVSRAERPQGDASIRVTQDSLSASQLALDKIFHANISRAILFISSIS